MATCWCDGPAHTYDPRWCRAGRDAKGEPINKNLKAAELELRAAQLRAEAEARND